MIWEYKIITHGGSFDQMLELSKDEFFTDRGNVFRIQPAAIDTIIGIGKKATEEGISLKLEGESGEVMVWIKPEEVVGVQFNLTKKNEPQIQQVN